MNKKYVWIIMFVIVFLAGVLRIYKLDKIPPSLNWDEVAASYNAYTISHWGKDEWGKTLPLVFKSFRDDKHPVHIYLTAPFVGIFGLSDFNARFPSALISVGAVVLMYFLAMELFGNIYAALFSSFFLAISPYHIHFSRGLWEVDYALFFFLLALTAFFKAIKKNPKYFPLSFLSFGICLYSYHSSKVIVPSMMLLLFFLYFREIKKNVKNFALGLLIFLVFIIGFVFNPGLLGLARVNQTKFSDEMVKSTKIYQQTSSQMLGNLEITVKNYPSYFSPDYLFEKGDQNPRNSVKVFGEFYKTDAVLLTLGVIFLLLFPSKATILLFTWVILAPFPSAISSLTPNATRAIFMLGSFQLISGFGAGKLVSLIKGRVLKVLVSLLIIVVLLYEFSIYWQYYLNKYPATDAIEWQYGMKQIVEYVSKNPDYYKVYVDKVRQQPYIFFLNYLKYPLPDFLKTVKYDQTESKSYNTVLSFDKFQFGGWDWVESYPSERVLYVLEPSKYSGLKFINDFPMTKLIKYPSGTDAFYMVSGGWEK